MKTVFADLSVIAFKIVAVLEAYQLQMERLTADWRNRSLHRVVAALLGNIGSLLGALPQLAVDMVEVIICHVKLVHFLQGQGAGGDVSGLQLRQTDAVSTLRRKTLRLICPEAGC